MNKPLNKLINQYGGKKEGEGASLFKPKLPLIFIWFYALCVKTLKYTNLATKQIKI